MKHSKMGTYHSAKGKSKARRKSSSPLKVKRKSSKTIGSPGAGKMTAKSSNNLRRG